MIDSMPVASLVSGGSRGLGLAIVKRLLDRGDRVATFSRSGSPELDALVTAHSGRLLAARLDAGDPSAVRGFTDRVVTAFGRIDHCIASAAVAHDGVLATLDDDAIDSMIHVNLRGAIVLIREAVRQMLVQPDGGRGCSIVVISSLVAGTGSPGLSVYAATKAGLEGFARSLARELGPRGIRVNAVAPGYLETDLSASLSAEHRGRLIRRTPLGRLGRPDDIVGAIDFLSGPHAAFITGQTVTIDGGSG